MHAFTRLALGTSSSVVLVSLAAGGCKSNDISATTNNFVSQSIGANGGDFVDPQNFEEIVVPAGALTSTVTFRLGTLAEGSYPALPSGTTAESAVFAFQPYDEAFPQSAAVTIFIPSPSSTGLSVYRAPSDTSGPWAELGSSPIAKTDNTGVTRNYLEVSTTVLGVFTLATSGAVADSGAPEDSSTSQPPCPNLIASECFTAANVTFTSGMGGSSCVATITAGGDGIGCGGCTFQIQSNDNTVCTVTTKDGATATTSDQGTTVCADASSVASEAAMANSCAIFGGAGN